ncbi:SSI family serine proteinase inhibitor [Streptomyces sp. NPDC054794]
MTYLSKATAARGALLAVAALLAASPAAVAGSAAHGDLRSRSWLHLTVTQGEVLPPALAPVGPGDAPVVRSALLLCDPPQGHPHAAEACAELAAAGGDIGRIPPREDAVCALIYAPVTARATGVWQGRPVEYRETFANACVMTARTGSVFALDD